MFARKATVVLLAALGAGLVISNVWLWTRLGELEVENEGDPPALPALRLEPSAEQPELAPYMARLQGLTHKLGLAVAAGNRELGRFYLYESREHVVEILEAVPEYRGQPVALLAERFLNPAYAQLKQALDQRGGMEQLREHYEAVVSACNGCHAATRHAFIRIPATLPDNNPFLQTFEAEDGHARADDQ